MSGRIIGGLGRETLFHQRRLALEIDLGKGDVFLGLRDVDPGRGEARRQIADVDLRRIDRRVRLRDAQRIGVSVDAKEQLPFRDLLPLAHRDLGYQPADLRSEEHTSELQSLMRISYAVFCLKKKNKTIKSTNHEPTYN